MVVCVEQSVGRGRGKGFLSKLDGFSGDWSLFDVSVFLKKLCAAALLIFYFRLLGGALPVP